MLSRQEMFDRGLNGLRKQGKASMSAKGKCAYRGEGGCRCVIGFSIHDQHYKVDMEDTDANSKLVREALKHSGYPLNHLNSEDYFPLDLQKSLHDDISATDTNKEFLLRLEKAAKKFARDYKLKYEKVNK